MKPIIISFLLCLSSAASAFFFNDPGAESLWYFQDAKPDPTALVLKSGISVNAAYKKYGTSGTTPVIVGVVDSGIDFNHEDLKDVLWVNSKEISNNGIDDDGNGYIDDIYGISTYDRDSSGKANGNVTGVVHHGTHMAGIIGAQQNNEIGVTGIASNVRIMSLKSFPIENEDTIAKDIAESLLYAAKNGARIINCSISIPIKGNDHLLQDTLNYIEKKYKVLLVVSAAQYAQDQDLEPDYPGSFKNDNILVVAGTDFLGVLNSNSNYGKMTVDVAAPGTAIYSTIMGNEYFSASGTSQATAIVSGVAAEVLSRHPNFTVAQLKDVLMRSVTKKDNLAGLVASGGVIDLLGALDLANTIQ